MSGSQFWASYFLGAVLDRQDTGTLVASLELWSMTWLAVLFLMSVALLVVDAATGIGLLFPKIVAITTKFVVREISLAWLSHRWGLRDHPF